MSMISGKNPCAEQIAEGLIYCSNICSNIISTFKGIHRIVDLHMQSFYLPHSFLLCVNNFINRNCLINDLFLPVQDAFLADWVNCKQVASWLFDYVRKRNYTQYL